MANNTYAVQAEQWRPSIFGVIDASLQLGKRTLREIQAEAIRRVHGELLTLDLFARLVERLDADLLLDSPRFRERLAGPIRDATDEARR